MFHETEELKVIRPQIGRKFIWRIAGEDFPDYELRTYAEDQFLDIDDTREKAFDGINLHLYATGGGCYTLPVRAETVEKVRIINYINFAANGSLQLCDFRIANFITKEGDICG